MKNWTISEHGADRITPSGTEAKNTRGGDRERKGYSWIFKPTSTCEGRTDRKTDRMPINQNPRNVPGRKTKGLRVKRGDQVVALFYIRIKGHDCAFVWDTEDPLCHKPRHYSAIQPIFKFNLESFTWANAQLFDPVNEPGSKKHFQIIHGRIYFENYLFFSKTTCWQINIFLIRISSKNESFELSRIGIKFWTLS